ncbi:helix-turn-helix domain-containing protein [Lacihabitans sp. CS3-21]|jgi:excisionase family DNA binding protein|uniref:helix-turn-helix domain-containing protein n=1 Tax=Lacihabitans sp. CS3-21 TaxID=2487332 RepID=UPI0020CF5CAE|nr:helix-turn-helix domain-containing protein [Lacihabitans sp. CS3-21]MCP9748345.1 DNA-binding protein [Lacihabitans sp. CS3-21]
MNSSNSLQSSGNNPTELLTRKQAAEFLHINLSTLWDWTKDKKIPAYGIRTRVYYKKSELLDALRPLN